MFCSTHLGSTVDLANFIVCVVNSYLVPLLILFAVVAFTYFVVQFIGNSADEKKREEAHKYIIWSLLALAIIVAVWGLVNIVTNTFGIHAIIPQFPTQ